MTRRTLGQMLTWIDKAHVHAEQKRYDAAILLHARLTPDMYPLVRQYGLACDSAKFAAARMSGQAPPSHPDNETTWEPVRARLRDVMGYLETFGPEAFAGAATAQVKLPRAPGKYLEAGDYFHYQGLPNFYFHATTAYLILRHNGVELGKTDFLGQLPLKDLPA